MCHRRSEWSRTADSATESDDERERDREQPAGWSVRAKDRLTSMLSVGSDSERAASERETPTADAQAPTVDPEADESGDATEPDSDEREEEPIPADD